MTGGEMTERSDIYALGVVVYELLTGRLPYRSQTTTGLIGEKLARPVPSLSAQRGDLPRAIDAVVQRATMPEASRPLRNRRRVRRRRARRPGRPARRSSTTDDAVRSPAGAPPQRARWRHPRYRPRCRRPTLTRVFARSTRPTPPTSSAGPHDRPSSDTSPRGRPLRRGRRPVGQRQVEPRARRCRAAAPSTERWTAPISGSSRR